MLVAKRNPHSQAGTQAGTHRQEQAVRIAMKAMTARRSPTALVQCDLAPDASQVPEVFVVPAKAADMQDDSIQSIQVRVSGPLWRSSFHPDDQQFDKSEADVRFRVSFP